MSWRRRKQREQDLDRELRAHLELEAEQHQDAGLPPDRARHAAQRALGNTTSIKETVREMWGWTSVERFFQDLHYAGRAMRRSPAFFTAAVLILAMGIGVNATIFSVVRAVMLNPLPYPDADRLVMFWKTSVTNSGSRTGVSPADFLELQQMVRTCSPVAAFMNTLFDVTGVDEPYRVSAARISANFFVTLGVHPDVGRDFTPDDDRPSAARVAILSQDLWQRRFGGNPNVVGSSITLNGESYVVAGVMPVGFTFPEGFGPGAAPAVWTPLRFAEERSQRGSGYMIVVARLRPNLPQATAQAELRTVSRQFE